MVLCPLSSLPHQPCRNFQTVVLPAFQLSCPISGSPQFPFPSPLWFARPPRLSDCGVYGDRIVTAFRCFLGGGRGAGALTRVSRGQPGPFTCSSQSLGVTDASSLPHTPCPVPSSPASSPSTNPKCTPLLGPTATPLPWLRAAAPGGLPAPALASLSLFLTQGLETPVGT